MGEIVFWQRIVSPHMFGLAQALCDQGYKVSYIAEEEISQQRKQMGWVAANSEDVKIILISDKDHITSLVSSFAENAVHLVQGARGNGIMEYVRKSLNRCGSHWGSIIETIDERSWNWPLKRLAYKASLSTLGSRPDFILAIGHKTSEWIAARGYPSNKIFPFSYFISSPSLPRQKSSPLSGKFRVGYIGQLIARKQVNLLIDALAGMDVELTIVGDGPLKEALSVLADKKLGRSRYQMLGTLPMEKINDVICELDCLVLPSEHDGWGVVVTEALMAGVPAICSDACGSAIVVEASGVGGVFPNGDVGALRKLLDKEFSAGKISLQKRNAISLWANNLGAEAGASYLGKIVETVYFQAELPSPPWV